ncbi:MAG: DUF1499 domain-containing protein [Fulvimarina manganoxydans]|uniref:DUF1499 domain-containing protein n=1 Tax=Fulvimarina manganoxydans TaxID=937218 RepID=UPI00235532E6|nr:DUF1499 domain-containing protein [Fulvimarina manganoxydans]MCK5933712.1 DUF1499 domain-containing protein [Fulvimarina manganoxydans]
MTRRRWRRGLQIGIGGATAAVIVTGVAVALVGPARIWSSIAGPADQGPVDFDRLARSPYPNDALACSRGVCGEAAEIVLPVYAAQPDTLLDRLDAVMFDGPLSGDAERVDDGTDPKRRRYVVRTKLMRFPDTLNAEARATDGGTALLLYSRSLLGRGDLGANAERLKRIAVALEGA